MVRMKDKIMTLFSILLYGILALNGCSNLPVEKPYESKDRQIATTSDNTAALNPFQDETPLPENILRELNAVRTNPKEYAEKIISPRLQYFIGSVYTGGKVFLQTQEGKTAVLECITALNNTQPMNELALETGLTKAAQGLADDQAEHGITGHTGSDGSDLVQRINRFGEWSGSCGENCAYGTKTAREIVVQLLIDDGVPSRGHRKNILNPAFQKVGTGFSDENQAPYGAVSVMDFAAEYTSN